MRPADGPVRKTVDLGGGVTMTLLRIPAGAFVMGDPNGLADERPATAVPLDKPFWMGACEVTNEQFARYDPAHDSGYCTKLRPSRYHKGPPLNDPRQPVVRVSWQQAMAFCGWLSTKTGLSCTLPTEAQWEYSCRAGTGTDLSYGGVAADFSPWANVADLRMAKGGFLRETLVLSYPADERFDDGYIVTAPVGMLQPNAWGLHDMHGNVAEWTATSYRPYPYTADDGRNDLSPKDPKVVRGGSFFDRPTRCRSAFRLAYPPWQAVYNVGFRVACP